MIGVMMFERSLLTPAALYKKVTLGGEMGEPRTLGVLPTELLETMINQCLCVLEAIITIITITATITTWHCSGVSVYLLWSMMLYSERSQAPSTKSPHTALSSTGEENAEENKKMKIGRSAFIFSV